MTDPNVLKGFTQKVMILAEAENIPLSDLIRSLQQNNIVRQSGTLPVIRRMTTVEANTDLKQRTGPATFEDFYLYVQSVSDYECHELTKLKHRDSPVFPKYFLSINEDHTVVGLMRQDRVNVQPITYAIFTFEPDNRMVILTRVVDGSPEEIATPYKISFDTVVGGNIASWHYVYGYQGSEIKDVLSQLLN